MWKKTIYIFSFLLVFALSGYSQKKKAVTFQVIIDTDCGLDDVRAISYLLGRKEVTVKAFIGSEGNVSVDNAVVKINSLLNGFSKTSIPICKGVPLQMNPPAWRSFNEQINWGKPAGKSEFRDIHFLTELLKGQTEKTTYLCLGPMTNLALTLSESPELSKKIDRVIWYCGSAKPISGFNYTADEKAAQLVLSSGIRIDIVSNLDLTGSVFDIKLFEAAKSSVDPVASTISAIHSQDRKSVV